MLPAIDRCHFADCDTTKQLENLAEMKTELRDVIKNVIIVAHKEDVSLLQNALQNEGWTVEVQRLNYTEEQIRYPAQSRCFMNHREAWRKAANWDGYTLICEADFVPCVGLGHYPVFWPATSATAWGYLYQGSPRLLSVLDQNDNRFLRGHCAPLVAYVINSNVANVFLDFFDDEAARHGLENYFTFDAHLQWFAMGRGAEAYIPFAHYGEHGGRPNVEHAGSGMLSRSGEHRADALAGQLSFLPQYAEGSLVRFWTTRLKYRLLGILRLATGRWITETNVYKLDPTARARMMWLGARRLLTP